MDSRRVTRPLVLLALAALIFASDRLSKHWALANLKPGEVRSLLGSFISLQLTFNPGAAFSFLENATWIFTVISTVICILIVAMAPRVRSPWWVLVLGTLLGGAAGNLVDRFTQPPAIGQGHVVDFLNWNGWFVGNVADIWIVGAAAAAALLAFLGVPLANPRGEGEQ